MYSTVLTAVECKTKLGFNSCGSIKRKSVLTRIMKVFANEKNIATTFSFKL